MGLTQIPRKAFDTVEQPIAKASESLLEKEAFMDALALAWKVNRSAMRGVERTAAAGMRVIGVPTRADVVDLVNQIGGLQRELRELRREVEAR